MRGSAVVTAFVGAGCATVLGLVAAAPAQAAPGMTWEFASLVAAHHWQQEGVAVPCRPAVRVLSAAEDAELQASFGFPVLMVADLPGCAVVVTPLAEWYRGHGEAWIYCAAVVHEVGHLAGLGHEHGGVMDHAASVVPFGCAHPRQWAVRQGWRQPPRWVRRSPATVRRLWLAGRVWRAQVVRARWLRRDARTRAGRVSERAEGRLAGRPSEKSTRGARGGRRTA